MLAMLPSIQGFLFEERDCKRDFVVASGPERDKIVFTLLYKVIINHVRLSFIDVWGPRFENLL